MPIIYRCKLSDWKEEPERLLAIENSALRQFALQINHIWKDLCRTVKNEVSYFKKKHRKYINSLNFENFIKFLYFPYNFYRLHVMMSRISSHED